RENADREGADPEPDRVSQVEDPGVAPDEVEGDRERRVEEALGQQVDGVAVAPGRSRSGCHHDDQRRQQAEGQAGIGTKAGQVRRQCVSPSGKRRRRTTATPTVTAVAYTGLK